MDTTETGTNTIFDLCANILSHLANKYIVSRHVCYVGSIFQESMRLSWSEIILT